jgi:hypothetical protein
VAADLNGRLPERVEAGALLRRRRGAGQHRQARPGVDGNGRPRPERGRLLLRVRDDGIGGADPKRGTGLRGLTDRLQALGGTFEVDSLPGRGTELRAAIPCE